MKKIIGIFAVTLLIATAVLPVIGAMNIEKTNESNYKIVNKMVDPPDWAMGEFNASYGILGQQSIELGWADCGNEEWAPTEKNCHVNVTELCSVESTLKPIRGWLFYDLEGINKVKFVAHSVVQAEDGMLYDITPPNDKPRPPFIIATENEEYFEKLVINIGDFYYEP